MSYAGVGDMVAPRSRAVRTPITQALIPVAPLVARGAPGVRPFVRPKRVPLGRDVYASRFANAAQTAQRLGAEAVAANGEAAPALEADASFVNRAVAFARQQGQPVAALAAQFQAAGLPIDETRAVAFLEKAHQETMAASVENAAAVARQANALPMLDANGRLVMVDASSDPAVLAVQRAAQASSVRPVAPINPLAAAALVPSPADQAAAAVFGQAAPSPQMVIQAQVDAPATTPRWVIPAIVLVAGWMAYGALKRGH